MLNSLQGYESKPVGGYGDIYADLLSQVSELHAAAEQAGGKPSGMEAKLKKIEETAKQLPGPTPHKATSLGNASKKYRQGIDGQSTLCRHLVDSLSTLDHPRFNGQVSWLSRFVGWGWLGFFFGREGWVGWCRLA